MLARRRGMGAACASLDLPAGTLCTDSAAGPQLLFGAAQTGSVVNVNEPTPVSAAYLESIGIDPYTGNFFQASPIGQAGQSFSAFLAAHSKLLIWGVAGILAVMLVSGGGGRRR